QKADDSAAVNRTTIVIAHKLATIKNADKIVGMKDGQVIEEGTHTQLIAKNSAYACFVDASDLVDEDDNEKGDKESTELEREKTLIREKSAREAEVADEFNWEAKGRKKMNLLKCIYILLRENLPKLWPHYLASMTGAFIGGLVYPVQA